MTLVFGVLNLIVAVIVDVFAQSRDKDVYARATEMEEEERDQKAVLGKIFKRIDSDGGGTLSYAELVRGACKELWLIGVPNLGVPRILSVCF
mmetsp:Transcript_120600/g.385084  ORF Transcript_120600/g.385084 Transcript_120600/m.385084 type:complete len:92 (+) Transcript_120600:1-276(+)